MEHKNVYLDYAATSPIDPEILEKMIPLLKERFGNPSSPHSFGRAAAYALSEARDRIAAVLGVRSNEIYFTSGGTEADNFAVRGLGEGDVCVSAIEHSAVLESSELRSGVTCASVGENGIVTAENVAAAMSPDTGVVCVMAVNNETGCIQPLREISALCRERKVLFFSDCVQAACSQDLKEICSYTDAISLSAHKIGGPKGVGALVVKKGAKLRPLVVGGEQERGLRGGTQNVAGIVGFSYALEKAQRERDSFCRHTGALRDTFEDFLLNAHVGVRVDGENRVPNISHLTFEKGGTALLQRLDLGGIACSGGAACSAQSALPSHVMRAMSRSEDTALKGIRFSFGAETTEEDTLYAARTLVGLLK